MPESFESRRAAFEARLKAGIPSQSEQYTTVQQWKKRASSVRKSEPGGFERDYDGGLFGGRDMDSGANNSNDNGKGNLMASQKNLDLDALLTLIFAVGEYNRTLQENYVVLRDAAEVCDEAMGSDYIMQNKILPDYNEGLGELVRITQLVAEVREELKKEFEVASSFTEG